MDENLAQDRIGIGYAHLQLAKAFTTAHGHESPKARRRAEERLRQWQSVGDGIRSGQVRVGSRTPVKGFPAWVTPVVLRGGFATGEAAAATACEAYDVDAAFRAGVRSGDREGVFRYFLTDDGLIELYGLLDSGRYEVSVPEEAVLPTVAWLLRAGDRAAALKLVQTVLPFAGKLRFGPRPGEAPSSDETAVHRDTVGDVRSTLAARKPKPAIEAMNEALRVWNPFADQLLAHWLETVEDGRVGAIEPEGWRARGRELLGRYARLAAAHTRCGKHRKPKENPAILRVSLEVALSGRAMTGRQRGLLQHAVDSMVARRGAPGTDRHSALRERQAADAEFPTLHELARVLLARLSGVPDSIGLPSTAWLLAPVDAEEAEKTGVRAGTAIPDTLVHVVERALSAPVATLVERGIVPSAEVLAELVPQLVASTTALAYHDASLRTLMAAVYRAFANRRSLLLLNLEHQVKLDELPWVQAVSEYRLPSSDTSGNAKAALAELGALTLRAFPGTIVPNPMLQELHALARQSAVPVVFTEELAADIFMGTFSAKFLRAAQNAGELLEDSLYARYYGIDYAALGPVDDARKERGLAAATSGTFAALCRERAGDTSGRSWVAANGMVIEQAQILTTQNLATLVHPGGVEPADGWAHLARKAFTVTCRLVGRIPSEARPLATIKDGAYAWRQCLFFLSLCSLPEQFAVIAWMQDEADRRPPTTTTRLAPVLTGLRHVFTGGSLDTPPPGARRFLGWSNGGHWMHTAA